MERGKWRRNGTERGKMRTERCWNVKIVRSFHLKFLVCPEHKPMPEPLVPASAKRRSAPDTGKLPTSAGQEMHVVLTQEIAMRRSKSWAISSSHGIEESQVERKICFFVIDCKKKIYCRKANYLKKKWHLLLPSWCHEASLLCRGWRSARSDQPVLLLLPGHDNQL